MPSLSVTMVNHPSTVADRLGITSARHSGIQSSLIGTLSDPSARHSGTKPRSFGTLSQYSIVQVRTIGESNHLSLILLSSRISSLSLRWPSPAHKHKQLRRSLNRLNPATTTKLPLLTVLHHKWNNGLINQIPAW